MIVNNERDERTAAWLIEQYGTEAIERAKTQLAGARKLCTSNTAKMLGARLPEAQNGRAKKPHKPTLPN